MSGSRPVWIRWGVPASIVWAGVLLSAWVYTRRLAQLPNAPDALGVVLLGAPAAGTALILLVRGVARRAVAAGEPEETLDLVLIWATACLFVLHASVLAVVLGVLTGLLRPVAATAALFFLGLAPLIGSAEHRSPVGLRTPRTMASAETWAAAHRRVGFALVLAGSVAGAAAALESQDGLVLAVTLAGLGLLVGAAPVGKARASGGEAPAPKDGAPAAVNPEAPPPVEPKSGGDHHDA